MAEASWLKRLIFGLAMLKRRKRRAPHGFDRYDSKQRRIL
jgi:hypothetical protein